MYQEIFDLFNEVFEKELELSEKFMDEAKMDDELKFFLTTDEILFGTRIRIKFMEELKKFFKEEQ